MTEWNHLPETLQIHLAASALRQATESLASFAEQLAGEIEGGDVPDEGGPEMLRLFAEMVRAATGWRESGVRAVAHH